MCNSPRNGLTWSLQGNNLLSKGLVCGLHWGNSLIFLEDWYVVYLKETIPQITKG